MRTNDIGWRRVALRTAAATLLLSAAAIGGAPLAQTPPLVKLATAAPEGSTWHMILKEMGEKWSKAPGGGVNLRIYAGGVLGDEPDMVRKMRVGQIQAAALTAVGLAEIDNAVSALQIPMLVESYDELDNLREKMRPTLERRLQERGFVVLNWGDAGWVMFFAKEPFTRPDDLKGRKLFVWAGDAHAVDLWKAAGFHPVPLASTDILPGLQTGLINAFDTTPLLALSSQWFGLAPHMLDLKWAPLIGATVISKKSWDATPAASRDALMKSAAEAGDRLKGEIRGANDKAIEAMVKRGLTVRAVTPEVAAEWRKAAESAYPKIRGTLVPADMFDEAVRLTKEYRAGKGSAAGGGTPGG